MKPDKDYLQRLVDSQAKEGTSLEFKEKLDDRQKLLRTVAAFANTAGGDMIYGAAEKRDAQGDKRGMIEEIVGINWTNEEEEKLRLRQFIQDNIQERIWGLEVETVPGYRLGPAVAIRVAHSHLRPHAVTFKKDWRFYVRRGASTVPLEVPEIRAAFEMAGDLRERFRRFRAQRLAMIESDEIGTELPPGPRIVLHLIPLAAMDYGVQVTVDQIKSSVDHYKAGPLGHKGWNARINVDGYLFTGNPDPDSYVQYFTDGSIEAATTRQFGDVNGRGFLAREFQDELVDGAKRYFKVLRDLEIPTPIFVALSVENARGCYLFSASGGHTALFSARQSIDRDAVLVPEEAVTTFDEAEEVLFRCLDKVWQASGFPKAPR